MINVSAAAKLGIDWKDALRKQHSKSKDLEQNEKRRGTSQVAGTILEGKQKERVHQRESEASIHQKECYKTFCKKRQNDSIGAEAKKAESPGISHGGETVVPRFQREGEIGTRVCV